MHIYPQNQKNPAKIEISNVGFGKNEFIVLIYT